MKGIEVTDFSEVISNQYVPEGKPVKSNSASPSAKMFFSERIDFPMAFMILTAFGFFPFHRSEIRLWAGFGKSMNLPSEIRPLMAVTVTTFGWDDLEQPAAFLTISV